MSNKQEGTVDLYCLSMPKSQYEFTSKNEELAKVVGMAILSLTKLVQAQEDIKKYATDVNVMRQYMKEGTDEELQLFLNTAFNGVETRIVAMKDLPEDVAEEVQKEMGDDLLVTYVNEKED